MKILGHSLFSKVIEYTNEANRRAHSERTPQTHRMSGSEITEPVYYFKMKSLSN